MLLYIDGLMGEAVKKSDLFHFEDNTRLVKILKNGGEDVSQHVQLHLLLLVQDPSPIADFSLLRSQPAQSTGGATKYQRGNQPPLGLADCTEG